MDEIGPADYMIVAFSGNEFRGEIARALADLEPGRAATGTGGRTSPCVAAISASSGRSAFDSM